jgi:hypothetical protein
LQFALLFLDEPIEFVEQLAIAFRDRVDDTSEHWLDFVRAVTEQTVNHVFFDPTLKLRASDDGGIQESATLFSSFEQLLFEKPIERGHDGGVSDALVERAVNIADTHFAETPRFFEHFTFELAECEANDFARTTKSAKEKSRSFHTFKNSEPAKDLVGASLGRFDGHRLEHHTIVSGFD